jgi:hypothetical protein
VAKATGIEEADLRDGLRDGGKIQQVLAVARPADDAAEFVAYLRVSWALGYHLLRRWRGRGDRVFQTSDAVLQTAWRHGYRGPVIVYCAGDPALARYRGVSIQDGGCRPIEDEHTQVADREPSRTASFGYEG